MLNTQEEIVEFTMTPVLEKYYNEDSAWGVFNFSTKDDIPEYVEYVDPFEDKFPASVQKMSTLAGKMQQLYIGSEYRVKAYCQYNDKYKQYQYAPISIVAMVPQTQEEQKMFLSTLTKGQTAENILKEYPNVVEDVMNGNLDELEYDKIPGVGQKTWYRIKESIIKNYVISDIITLLQPLGVTYNMIKKLLQYESNPTLLKEKLLKNPYIMTKIHGFGFKRVDDLALKLKPELRTSAFRLSAFIMYHLNIIGENDGHTWITIDNLKNEITNNIPECYELLDDLLQHNLFLYIEDDKVGLKKYYETEKRIYQLLIDKQNIENNRVIVDYNDKIDEYIRKSEQEQGFEFTEEQRRVILESLNSNLSIISGKAGVGKSCIARGILNVYRGFNYSIATCALSAKAAQRITEATGFASSTIHRLLGSKGLNDFKYNEENTLPFDVILIDEGSMINASLFLNLLLAIGMNTKVIICGDHMQLPPIGYGNVFSDILHREEFESCSFQLTKPMRQAELSGILSDANMIRDGISPLSGPAPKIIRGALRDMYYMFKDNRESLTHVAINTFMSSIKTDGLDEVVIITPRKQGCLNSSTEINKIVQDKLLGNEVNSIESSVCKFKLGAKVIQTVNNYEKNIFNGEIGYIAKISAKQEGKKTIKYCEVEYPNLVSGAVSNKKIVEYKNNELNELELAYALTTHKCITDDTLLFSDNGIIELKDLNNGANEFESKELCDDIPYIYNGHELERPKAFYNAGISDCIKITSQRGYSLTATLDHKVDILNEEGYIEPKYVKDITEDDYLVLISGSDVYGNNIKLPKEWEVDVNELDVRTILYKTPMYLTKELSRFLGYMVADGVIADGGIHYGKNHKNVVIDFNNIVYQLFGYSAKDPRHIDADGKYGGMFLSEVCSKYIKKFCDHIDGIQPNQKFVPHIIMTAPKEMQVEFLRGVFEDGSVCVKNNKFEHISFTSCYEKLANQIQLMLLNMGIISTKMKRYRVLNGKEFSSYTLFLYGKHCDSFIKKIGFISNEKMEKAYRMYDRNIGSSSQCVIPYVKKIVERIAKENKIKVTDMRRVLRKNRQLTYETLEIFLQYCKRNNIYDDDIKYLTYLCKKTSIQKVKSLQQTREHTYCIEMPLTHKFVQNGFSAWNCQGSGYKTVIGIIDNTHYILLDNCMLYTLITRAKKRCLLLAEPSAFMKCIKTNYNSSRHTWLSLEGVIG